MKRCYKRFGPVFLALVVLLLTASVMPIRTFAQATFPQEHPAQLNLRQSSAGSLAALVPALHRPSERLTRSSQLTNRPGTGFAEQLVVALPTPRQNGLQAATAVCLVTTTADSGGGSLRDCLSNATSGDVIQFDTAVFPPSSPATISVLTPLPSIVVDSLTIDGSNAGVIVNGSQLSAGSGFELLEVDNITIQGLQIVNFPWVGVDILINTTNAIIGGDRNVGTGPLGQGNLISGNAWAGVWILGDQTTGNVIQGNYIGTNLAGNSAYGGQELGLIIAEGAHDNFVGGPTASTRNVISGHFDLFSGSGTGVFIQDPNSDNNLIQGNLIGTDASGTAAVNNYFGVVLMNGTQGNIIGGSTAAQRNIISGNFGYGIWIGDDPSLPNDINITTNNQIIGNYIGTNINGTAELFLQSLGILVDQYSSNITIGGTAPGMGNLISGHSLGSGVQFQGPNNSGHQVLGNFVGTNASGTAAIGNGQGIAVAFGTQNVTIGGTTPGARNVVSGNVGAGILIQDVGSTGNQVLGNYVGTNPTGTASLPNDSGIGIINGAAENSIGGSITGAGNLVSGNNFIGIQLQGNGSSQNIVQGNIVGLDVSGTQAIMNVVGIGVNDAQNNQIGGSTAASRNLISGNQVGLTLQSSGASGNLVLGNLIGTNAAGDTAVPNDYGIQIVLGAHNNTIGGDTLGAGNLISGNRIVGLAIHGTGSAQNNVWGNLIGTNLNGTTAIGNDVGIGLLVGASQNEIGGTTSAKRNLISGNQDAGVLIQDRETETDTTNHGTTANWVAGNYIGTNLAGDAAIANKWGVAIAFGTAGNRIGGVEPGARNVISGNTDAGVQIEGVGASANQVEGNTIGLNAAGTGTVANYDGITLIQGASDNLIGGATTSAGNVISGNAHTGIFVQGQGTSGNLIQGNQIGTSGSDAAAWPNGSHGLLLTSNAEANQVGPGNKIMYNGGNGIAIDGNLTVGNTITQNSIYRNTGAELQFLNPNTPTPIQSTPQIEYLAASQIISATLCANCTIEVFGNTSSEPAGEAFIRQCVTDGSGILNCQDAAFATWPYLAITVTDAGAAGTTSGFYAVGGGVEPSCDYCVYLPLAIK
ncbi:MAG: hypothetical protein KC445_03875 [Anaerolineales bacterium]|nr:hypothetical protein [Anaerolineales bacterium]